MCQGISGMGEGKLVMCQLISGVCQSISGMDRIHSGVCQSHLYMHRLRSAMSGSRPDAAHSRPTSVRFAWKCAQVRSPPFASRPWRTLPCFLPKGVLENLDCADATRSAVLAVSKFGEVTDGPQAGQEEIGTASHSDKLWQSSNPPA